MLVLLVALLGGCTLSAIGALALWWLERRLPQSSAPRYAPRYAYWNDACFSSDEKLMAAGGAGFAVLDLETGAVLGRGNEDVYDVACPGASAAVLGYQATWSWPGGSRAPVVPRQGGALLAAFEDGTRVWAGSRSGRSSRGTLLLEVGPGATSRQIELGPADFGEVGRAKSQPSARNFSMSPGGALRGHRLLLAAGWQPNRAGAWVEPVPFGFFALNLDDGRVEKLLGPIAGDAAPNLVRRPAVRASADEGLLALATSNGSSATVAIYGGTSPVAVVTALEGWDEISRLAVAPDGSRVAVASAFHGEGHPARIVVLESRHGRKLWSAEVPAAVAGLALLRDGSLVWASSARGAERVALSGGRLAWRMQMSAP